MGRRERGSLAGTTRHGGVLRVVRVRTTTGAGKRATRERAELSRGSFGEEMLCRAARARTRPRHKDSEARAAGRRGEGRRKEGREEAPRARERAFPERPRRAR